MKSLYLVLLLGICSFHSFSQKNTVLLSGGYAFGNINYFLGIEAKGWRVTGTFEIHPPSGDFVHSLSIGFTRLTGHVGTYETEVNAMTWPVCYAPKFVFGNGPLKGFIKSSFGVQFSSVQFPPPIDLSDGKIGMAFGGGAGFSYSINEKLFFNAEYELLLLQNSFYTDQLLTTASLGIGMRL